MYDSQISLPTVWLLPTCSHLFAVSIGLMSFFWNGQRSKASLSSAIRQRVPLVVFNLLLVNISMFIVMKIKENTSFRNDSWDNKNNDSFFGFLLWFLLLDIGLYSGHWLLHNSTILKPYHQLHHSVSKPHAFDHFYSHPIDLFIQVLVPTMVSSVLSNNSRELTVLCLCASIMGSTLSHQVELNCDHVLHHQSKPTSIGIGLFMDPIFGTSTYTLDMQINNLLLLPLVYHLFTLSFPSVIFIFIFVMCWSYSYLNTNLTKINWIQQSVWNFWYNWFSDILEQHNVNELNLMNWGYYTDEADLNYSAGDKEAFKKMLYEFVLDQTGFEQFSDKRFLEIGCGRGGGIKFLLDSNKINQIIGVDASTSNVKNCRKILKKYIQCQKNKNVEIVVGNAMHFSQRFKDDEFDVVYNVESSHCYSDFGKFIQNVYNVLKPNGKFCFCDFRDNNEWHNVEKEFADLQKWKIIKKTNITNYVMKASDVMDEDNKALINQFAPNIFKHLFKDYVTSFGNMKHSTVRKEFESGKRVYKAYCIQKRT